MTAFQRSQVPDSIDTVEKLAAWSCSILAELNVDSRVAVNAATLDQSAAAGSFSFPLQADSPIRYVITSYLILDPSFRSGGNVWESSIQEFSDGVIPSGYLS